MPHEIPLLTRALQWWDQSDALAKAADGATDERERTARLKASMDASNCALRHWRALKWPTPDGMRRPGRPVGAEWSSKRKAAVNAQRETPAGRLASHAALPVNRPDDPSLEGKWDVWEVLYGPLGSTREEAEAWDSAAAAEPYRAALRAEGLTLPRIPEIDD